MCNSVTSNHFTWIDVFICWCLPMFFFFLPSFVLFTSLFLSKHHHHIAESSFCLSYKFFQRTVCLTCCIYLSHKTMLLTCRLVSLVFWEYQQLDKVQELTIREETETWNIKIRCWFESKDTCTVKYTNFSTCKIYKKNKQNFMHEVNEPQMALYASKPLLFKLHNFKL